MSPPAAGRAHRPAIGVLGPSDLVELVTEVASRESPALDLRAHPYSNEADTLDLIRRAPPEIEAWLFTGVVPYDLAHQAGVLRRPATYLDHTGATLYRALVEHLAAKPAWDLVSIDTLPRDAVLDAFRDARLPTSRVRVKEYRTGQGTAAFASFHRSVARTTTSSLAITCVRSVYDELDGTLPALRLVPALSSIRSALRAVSLVCDSAVAADAQVAIGLVDLAGPAPDLAAEARRLAGVAVPVTPTRSLLVTTRGVLTEATDQFRGLPLVERLREQQAHVHVGFGIGRTAAAAEALADSALRRATAVGPYAAVVSFGAETELTLGSPATGRPEQAEPISLPAAERRSGVSQANLRRIIQAAGPQDSGTVTAAEVARVLGLEHRSARRLLDRLVRAGVAGADVSAPAGGVGRPPKVYVLRIR